MTTRVGTFVLPKNHLFGMRVPIGGSSCAKCKFVSADQRACSNKFFQYWHGSVGAREPARLPAPANQYCCDVFEAGMRSNPMQENPLAPQTRNVLLGVAALGALSALFYAVNASAKSTTGSSGSSGGGGSLNFLIPTGAIDVGTADSGTTIHVGVGQSVVITVPNADPGYTWKIGYAGPNVMGSPKGDSSSGELVELYTVQLTGQQTITFTQLDMNGNINPNNGEYTFTFTSTLTNPVGGNKNGV